MPTFIDLTDSEGFIWDLRTDGADGLVVLDGESDEIERASCRERVCYAV